MSFFHLTQRVLLCVLLKSIYQMGWKWFKVIIFNTQFNNEYYRYIIIILYIYIHYSMLFMININIEHNTSHYLCILWRGNIPFSVTQMLYVFFCIILHVFFNVFKYFLLENICFIIVNIVLIISHRFNLRSIKIEV